MQNKNLFEKLFIKNKSPFLPIIGTSGSGKTTLLNVLFSENIARGGGGLFITDRGADEELQKILTICKSNKREDEILLLDFISNDESINVNIQEIVNSNKILIINYCGCMDEISVLAKSKIMKILISLIENCENSKEFMIFYDKSLKQENDLFISDVSAVIRSTNIQFVVGSQYIADEANSNIAIFLKTNLTEEFEALNPGQGYILINGKKQKFSFEKVR